MTRYLVGTALVLGLATPVPAVELDRGDLALEVTSHLRSLFTYTRDLDPERLFERGSTRKVDSAVVLFRARLDAQAHWRDRVYAQLTYDNEYFTGSGVDALQFQVAKEIGTRTWFHWDDEISESDHALWRHSIYRAWVRMEGDRWDLTLGRQRYALGVGRLWNPLDLFNPIFPLAIEGDQRIGQDGVSGRIRVAPGLWARGIWSPQNDPDEHRAAGLIEWSRRELDMTVMVGRFERDWVVGGSVATNWLGAAFRAEGSFSDLHERDDQIWQLVFGCDYTFSLGNGLYTFVEHLYNENRIGFGRLFPGGLPTGTTAETGTALVGAQQISALNRITTTSLHITGTGLGYDLTPLLRLDTAVLYDWSGPSVVFAPSLTWSVLQDLDLSLAGQLFYGPDGRSEYGGVSPLLILRADFYFL